ncbi:MAG: hypothetical protein ACT4RN_21725 [Pseudonocardia sp.]
MAEPFNVPTATPAPAAGQSAAEVELYGPIVELPDGLYLKQLGKVAEFGPVGSTRRDDWTMRVVLDRIEVDPRCNPYTQGDRPHRLVLHLRVETSERYDTSAGDDRPAYYRWSTIGADGVTEPTPNGQSTCRDDDALPFDLRASAKYRGEVTVDVSNAAGRLVLDVFAWDYPTG